MVRERVKQDESDWLFASCACEQVVPKDHFLVKLLAGVHLEGGAAVVLETKGQYTR